MDFFEIQYHILGGNRNVKESGNSIILYKPIACYVMGLVTEFSYIRPYQLYIESGDMIIFYNPATDTNLLLNTPRERESSHI